MNAIVKKLKDELKGFNVKAEPFNLLNLLFKKVNQISGEEIGKRREERLHSEMLFALLDSEKNGDLGLLLIEALLDELAIKVKPRTEFTVALERPIKGRVGNRRPIDILLSWKEAGGEKHAIIIENKIAGASDQDHQLNDYYLGLEREKFTIDKIIYITLSAREKTPKDAKPWVRKKIKFFSAKDVLPRWLNRGITHLKNSNNKKLSATFIIGVEQYKDFIECLNRNREKFMKANDILLKLTPTQLRDMLKLIYSKEWIEARFWNITRRLKESQGEELEANFQQHASNKSESGVPVITAKYQFVQPDPWIEVWIYEETLALYICSKKKKKPFEIVGICPHEGTDKAGSSGGRSHYYYYWKDGWEGFKYPEKASGVNEDLIQTAVSILDALKKEASKKRKRQR